MWMKKITLGTTGFELESRHNLPIVPNPLDRNFQPEQSNAVWSGDITYIETDEG